MSHSKLKRVNPNRVAVPANGHRLATPLRKLPAIPTAIPGIDPLVTIIVTTYNRPQMVRRAVLSVLKQHYANVECVVVNDGGADASAALADLLESDKRLSYHTKPNGGLASARNFGIGQARGELIGVLDDDDWLLPDHVRLLEMVIREEHCAIAYANAERHVQKRRGSEFVTVHRDVPFNQDFDPNYILIQNMTPVLAWLARKEVFAGCLFDESYPVLEDWEWLIRVSRTYRLIHVPQVTCVYTERTDGTSMMGGSIAPFINQTRRIYQTYSREAIANPQMAAMRDQKLAAMESTLRATSHYTLLLSQLATADDPAGMTRLYQPTLMEPFFTIAERMQTAATLAGDTDSAERLKLILDTAKNVNPAFAQV